MKTNRTGPHSGLLLDTSFPSAEAAILAYVDAVLASDLPLRELVAHLQVTDTGSYAAVMTRARARDTLRKMPRERVNDWLRAVIEIAPLDDRLLVLGLVHGKASTSLVTRGELETWAAERVAS
jgi:hypothetical protein